MNEKLKEGYCRNVQGETKRYCQSLQVNPKTLDEYKYWHDSNNIWEEIPQGIRQAGILDMEIYIVNYTAFMIIETPLDFEWDKAFGRLATYKRQLEWENFVAKFQITERGLRSEEKWVLVERVFSLIEALKR